MSEDQSVTRIRAAQTDDCQNIVAVHLQSWQETYRGILSGHYLAGLALSTERRIAWFAQTIALGQPQVWLAEREQQVLGFCSFGASRDKDAGPDTAELMAIYLLAQAQGQGLGRKLWQQAQVLLLEQGFTQVRAWVLAANSGALGFYRQQGFNPDANSRRVFEEDGQPFDLIRLSRAL